MDKYEEALEKARVEYEKARKQGYAWLMNLLEGMFPELKESEDERISRLIYCIIRDTPEVDDVLRANGRSVIEALAYLEKQKDLDKMIVVSPEVWDNAINDAYKNGKKNGEKQKEQKFTEKQDYSDLTDLERAIHRGFLVVGVENVPVTIIKETAQDCLAQMKQQRGANGNEKEIPNGQKPAVWSEEDEVYLQDALWCVKQAAKVARGENDMGACWSAERWLKSLRPQHQQNMSIGFMLYLDEIRPEGKMCLSNAECNDIEDAFKKQDWPRIFRYIEKYQPHWKPSEEQMEALDGAQGELCGTKYNEGLCSLIDDLKKLSYEQIH